MDTRKSSPESRIFAGSDRGIPALLVAWAPPDATDADHRVVAPPYTVGRSADADLTLDDDKVSSSHFRISRQGEGFAIADLKSTNGTFLDGVRVTTGQPLGSGAVIRAGRSVLVFHASAGPLLEPPETLDAERHGLAGRFHTGPLLRALREAALSDRHVLLTGPSGTGKELAARALAALQGTPDSPLPLLTHNAARFSSEEEATSTLFGVAPRVFSNVDARPGLLEEAQGGALFLDEVHNLPTRVQRSLLRLMEDGQLTRLGEVKSRPAEVRLILASNMPGPDHGLAHDLLARLRVVSLPPLADRSADAPTLFRAVLASRLAQHGQDVDDLWPLLGGDHFEALCLDGFDADNVRGLVDLSDRLATRLAAGADGPTAVTSIFQERFGDGPVARRQAGDADTEASSRSAYERNRDAIVAAYDECDGNLSATERLLHDRGLRSNRRWLAIFLERWGLR